MTAKDYAHISPEKGEKALIVKDGKGDWVVLVGRWVVFSNGKELAQPSECMNSKIYQVHNCLITKLHPSCRFQRYR